MKVNASVCWELESCYLSDHIGDGLDDLEMLDACHFVPAATQLDTGGVVHEYVFASDGV